MELVDISDWFAIGSVPPRYTDLPTVGLYSNPQGIDRGLIANYGSQSGLLSSLSNKTYLHSDRTSLKLTGILIDTECRDYDATPHLDQLERLVSVGQNSYPPVLALVWASRIIQPVVLTEISIQETGWANGLVSQAMVELSFEYVRQPTYSSDAEKKRRAGVISERKKEQDKKANQTQSKTPKPPNQPQNRKPKPANSPNNTNRVTRR